MSISKRVEHALKAMAEDDPEEALFQICAAIESTAKREGRPGGRSSFKGFIIDNMDIISRFGVGLGIARLNLGYSHPEIKVAANGTCTLEDIIYHAVRCGLYHEGQIDSNIQFTDRIIGATETAVQIPKHFVTGLIMAVVGSPANSKQTCHPDYWAAANGKRFYLNTYWGKANKLRKDMVATKPESPTSESHAPTPTLPPSV